MKLGIGLPAAVESVGVIDRLIYDLDVVLFPCSGDLEQVSLLAQVVRAGGTTSGDRVLPGAFPATERGANA